MFKFIKKIFLPAKETAVESARQATGEPADRNRDLVIGYKLSVTMNLGTPLNLLKRHNEIANNATGIDASHGIWTHQLDSHFDFLDQGASMASAIGSTPLNGGDFLPYLIGVREIIEKENKDVPDIIDAFDKCKKVRQLPHGHTYNLIDGFIKESDGLVDYFDILFQTEEKLFEHIIVDISKHEYKGLTVQHIIALNEQGFNSIESILNAPDKVLLSLKGIGNKKLATIRKNLS
ncbi:MAG: hypothetical protein ACI9D5_001060 [Candidatus Endobugula sp.]|jgi:hypothetical protein